MKKKSILTSLVLVRVLCAFVPPATAADQALERQLTSQYRGKILALRHSFKSNSQEYDSEGKPFTMGEEGPWTVYGRIVLKKVALNADKLRLEGNRVYYMVDDREKRLKPSTDHEYVKITILLKSPVSSADQVAAILNLVFAMSAEDIVKSAPSYWKAYLTEQNESGENQKKIGSPVEGAVPLSNLGGKAAEHEHWKAYLTEQNGSGQQVFKIGENEVSAPKVLYQPEPAFSDPARKMRYDGTLGINVIIDKSGNVRNPQLVHPLGMGLDENAVATISTWRFSPAMRNGQPVAVAVYIEVSFRLGR